MREKGREKKELGNGRAVGGLGWRLRGEAAVGSTVGGTYGGGGGRSRYRARLCVQWQPIRTCVHSKKSAATRMRIAGLELRHCPRPLLAVSGSDVGVRWSGTGVGERKRQSGLKSPKRPGGPGTKIKARGALFGQVS
jgi:hypothetical protein